MAGTNWQVEGQYYETCNCDFVCPCMVGQLAVTPTKGSCIFSMAFQIERGSYGTTTLDGLSFIVLGSTPEAMGKGNWSVGVIADAKASTEQRDAITAIASGSAGGPMAALSGLVGKFLGVESAPIEFSHSGAGWSIKAPGLMEMSAMPAMGFSPNISEPLCLENAGHPAANKIKLAHALESHVHALGLSWDETAGKHNGQYAPFSWRDS